MKRFAAWRRSEAGIWSEWAAVSIASLSMVVVSIAYEWHWIVTVALILVAILICGLVLLMASIRNDLGDTDPQWVFRSREGDVSDTAAAMIPEDDDAEDERQRSQRDRTRGDR